MRFSSLLRTAATGGERLPVVQLFTRAQCCLCVPVKFVLHKAQRRFAFRLEEVDIAVAGNEHHLAAFTNDIPVVHLEGREIARHRLEEPALLKALQEAGVKQTDGQQRH